ncbi:hypothetical protein K431DRAFT_314292 [Polychaeton citri CBS 116435]|uniref:Uncharacterized protein n=1 Tax=Polychaeton citri CBS 116435 TaxID=1314669 RepID=A0A9P4Q254_9PEZI|nr:hypothetical protein K431DRAFT_314292 [Polychaeton citri CBS 116435]
MSDTYGHDPNEDIRDGRQFDFGTWEDGLIAINAGFASPPPPDQPITLSRGHVDPRTTTHPMVSEAINNDEVEDASIQIAADSTLHLNSDMDRPDKLSHVDDPSSLPPLLDNGNNNPAVSYFSPFLFANHMAPNNEARAAAVARHAAALSPTPSRHRRQSIVDEMRKEDLEAEWREEMGDNGETMLPPPDFSKDIPGPAFAHSLNDYGPMGFASLSPSKIGTQSTQQVLDLQQIQRSESKEASEIAQDGEGLSDDDGKHSEESSDDDASVESTSHGHCFFDVVHAPVSAQAFNDEDAPAQLENILKRVDSLKVPTDGRMSAHPAQSVITPQLQEQGLPAPSIEYNDIRIAEASKIIEGKMRRSPTSILRDYSESSDEEEEPQKKKAKLSYLPGSDDEEFEYKLASVKASDTTGLDLELNLPSPGSKDGSSSPASSPQTIGFQNSPDEAAVHRPRNPMGEGELKALKDNHGAKRVSTSPRRTRSRGAMRRVSERIARRTPK